MDTGTLIFQEFVMPIETLTGSRISRYSHTKNKNMENAQNSLCVIKKKGLASVRLS
jgi:hypothetical protein